MPFLREWDCGLPEQREGLGTGRYLGLFVQKAAVV
jgi:hypothetical protein